MAIQTTALKRFFKYGSVKLPDPGSHLSPEQVRNLFSATYPELASSSIEGPVTKASGLEYEFRRAVGTKG
ncbi:PRTRC system protein C [Crenobacter sp. SG2305]|uniref:PRTRC system protein C n=1 Tax=Crenobacter oryzisoli TaxID=3056844 RepID=UPI0025AAA5C4|nr:PRTRC system protein C [Crenobacter sp. SG2305]MDN0082351.1 PRTRC system protein C [Crenobacter sp. SG2305]